MIPEIILGLIVVCQQFLHFKQSQGMREEIRLANNREYARSIPELATLQQITRPAKSEVASAIRKGLSEPPEPNPFVPSLPYGL